MAALGEPGKPASCEVPLPPVIGDDDEVEEDKIEIVEEGENDDMVIPPIIEVEENDDGNDETSPIVGAKGIVKEIEINFPLYEPYTSNYWLLREEPYLFWVIKYFISLFDIYLMMIETSHNDNL